MVNWGIDVYSLLWWLLTQLIWEGWDVAALLIAQFGLHLGSWRWTQWWRTGSVEPIHSQRWRGFYGTSWMTCASTGGCVVVGLALGIELVTVPGDECTDRSVVCCSDFSPDPWSPPERGPDESHRSKDALHPGLAVSARVWNHSFSCQVSEERRTVTLILAHLHHR